MKNCKTNKNISETFIHDRFFSKGNWLLKIWQVFLSLLAWLAVFIPIFWTLSATLLRHDHMIHMWNYLEGIHMFDFLEIAFPIAFIIILVAVLILTLRNNYITKHDLFEKTMYDEERLTQRTELLNDFYAERFGREETRHQAKTFTVVEEENIATHEIVELYRKGEELK